jgi:hypothetical protein
MLSLASGPCLPCSLFGRVPVHAMLLSMSGGMYDVVETARAVINQVIIIDSRSCSFCTPWPVAAVALTGVRAGVPLIVAYTLISMWTIHLLNALYLEYKRAKVHASLRLCFACWPPSLVSESALSPGPSQSSDCLCCSRAVIAAPVEMHSACRPARFGCCTQPSISMRALAACFQPTASAAVPATPGSCV